MSPVKRLLALALVTAATVPALGAGASARACAIVPTPRGPIVVGEQVEIDGAGDVVASGNVWAFGDVGGMDVRVVDSAGDAQVCLRGRPVLRPLPRARAGTTSTARVRSIRLKPGAKQRISIMGTKVRMTFRGDGNVMLSVTGIGRVQLDGVGTFRLNSRPAESWPLRPIVLPLRATPRGARG